MGRSNFTFEKRQKELARKKKKEEKRKRKLEKGKTPEGETINLTKEEEESQ